MSHVVINAQTQAFECRVCGATRSLDLPARVRNVVHAGRRFASEHRPCLPKPQRAALRWMCWALEHYGALATTRRVRRRDVERLVRRGLAQSAGTVVLADRDRWVDGWRPTEAGLRVARAIGEITEEKHEHLRQRLQTLVKDADVARARERLDQDERRNGGAQ